MITLWILLGTTWVAHAALMFVPSDAVMALLMGKGSPVVVLACASALLPQLVLVPWAWRDSRRRLPPTRARALWRLAFFLTGFAAVTLYLIRFRRKFAS